MKFMERTARRSNGSASTGGVMIESVTLSSYTIHIAKKIKHVVHKK